MKSVALITVFIPVLILAVPVFDTTFAMIRRKLSGKSVTQADKGHLHHRLLRHGFNQKQTVLALYSVSVIFGIIGNIVSTMHEKRLNRRLDYFSRRRHSRLNAWIFK